MITIEPFPGNVLVRLDMGSIPGPEKTHDTFVSGTVLAVNKNETESLGYLVGRTAYWRGFKDDCRLPNKEALIETKDILGSSYDNETD